MNAPASPRFDWLDTAARDTLTVTGGDAATYLHSQLSQDIAALADGATTWSFVLEPDGKATALLRIRRAGDTFELDVDAGYGEVVERRLRRFLLRVDVTIELQPAVAAQPTDEAEDARIAAGWPAMGAEIVPGETIPATTGVTEYAVSFTKGCYPGQELVERMDSRGASAPRSLRIVQAEGRSVGDAVVVDGADVGTITSVAPNGTLALATVKRGVDVGCPPSVSAT